MDTKESFEKIAKKMEGMRTCMFATRSSEGLKARPMAMQDVEFEGSVWFMTDKRSNKCREIEADPAVGLEYAHGNGVRFVSITGTASFAYDKEKIHEFWNPFYKAWFENEDDPNITLIEVKVKRAEYWDNKGGKVGGLADMAIGAVTGEANTLDEHEVLTFA
ncbi:MAG: pyridoxamine 5'-phosphate oxidase family protein [Patescibacteria group bacterium]